MKTLITFLLLASSALAQPPTGYRFVQGVVPADGHHGGYLATDAWDVTHLRPMVKNGQRLSGTVTIGVEYSRVPTPEILALPRRLLVDGVPQPSFEIDTTQWPIGTHAIQVQLMEPMALVVGSSRVVVINNSGTPYTGLADHAIAGANYRDYPENNFNSIAWGRVDVLPPQAYPLGHSDATHPDVQTDAEALDLFNTKKWWVDGYYHSSTLTYSMMPVLVKNDLGDYYITHWSPKNENGSAEALPWVERSFAFDGPRGVCIVSPYSTLSAGHHVLASGHSGWVGVDLAGRVFDSDISGEVATIFGPRNVAGVVPTDPDVLMTLAERITAGEKEFIGEQADAFHNSQDVWQDPDDHDILWVTDTGNARVAKLSRSQRLVLDSQASIGVVSVWVSPEERAEGVEWYAVNPDGLWRKKLDGTFIKVAAIPGAHWVRGIGRTAYVLTLNMALWEYNAMDGTVIQRIAPGTVKQAYSFMEVDANRCIGPRGYIYLGAPLWDLSEGRIKYVIPGEWIPKLFGTSPTVPPKTVNEQPWGNWQANNRKTGHYKWQFAIHQHMPKFLVGGFGNSSPRVFTGHLDPANQPIADPSISAAKDGLPVFRGGEYDRSLGLATVFGHAGHGRIGYSADKYSNSKTWAEAKPIIRADIDPMLPAGTTEQMRDYVGQWIWVQRTRKHFQ